LKLIHQNFPRAACSQEQAWQDMIVKSIMDDDDVNLHWSYIGVELDEEARGKLLGKITNEWITLRGFSFAGSFVELYTQYTKQSLQKSKGTRTKLQKEKEKGQKKTETS
jgi:hypothetical protein